MSASPSPPPAPHSYPATHELPTEARLFILEQSFTKIDSILRMVQNLETERVARTSKAQGVEEERAKNDAVTKAKSETRRWALGFLVTVLSLAAGGVGWAIAHVH